MGGGEQEVGKLALDEGHGGHGDQDGGEERKKWGIPSKTTEYFLADVSLLIIDGFFGKRGDGNGNGRTVKAPLRLPFTSHSH